MVFWKSVTTGYLIVNGQPECILISCSIWTEWVVFIYIHIYTYIHMCVCVCVYVCKNKRKRGPEVESAREVHGRGRVVELKRKMFCFRDMVSL